MCSFTHICTSKYMCTSISIHICMYFNVHAHVLENVCSTYTAEVHHLYLYSTVKLYISFN